MNLTELTIVDALQKLRAGDITATELATAFLARIDEMNPELNAYITVTRELALSQAAESDARYAAGNPLPLDGIPIAIKDNFCMAGIRTTAASRMLENFVPEYESTVTQKLIDAGAVMLGKTNMDEFAMSNDGTTSFFGETKNPVDKTLAPGGSSSGSAAAVAANMAMAATGTDTGDSIRVPAVFCNIVGMKPTYGICSRYGVIAYSSSLDHIGPMTKTVDDAALMLSVMAGHDEKDSTSAPNADEIAKTLYPYDSIGVKGLKIGIIKEFDNENIKSQISNLKSAGAEILEISIPHIMHTGTLYAVISRAEASSNLARYDGMRFGLRVPGKDLDDTYTQSRTAGFGDNVKKRLVTGAAMLTHDFYDSTFLAAAKVRRILDDEFTAAFNNCDLIITPTIPAFKLGENLSADENTLSNAIYVGANMSGLPAVVIPAHGGGIQIIGRRFDDARVLQLAKAIEEIK